MDLPGLDSVPLRSTMYRGQKAQDHETFEADTPMADNRRADHRRRAKVDRTR